LPKTDVTFRLENMTVNLTEVTAVANFGSSRAGSTRKMGNSGAGLRLGADFIFKFGKYGAHGLFNVSNGILPNLSVEWYGFNTNNEVTTLVRIGTAYHAISFPYTVNTSVLAVEMNADTVKFFIDGVEINVGVVPVPVGGEWYAAINPYEAGDKYRDCHEYAHTFLPI